MCFSTSDILSPLGTSSQLATLIRGTFICLLEFLSMVRLNSLQVQALFTRRERPLMNASSLFHMISMHRHTPSNTHKYFNLPPSNGCLFCLALALFCPAQWCALGVHYCRTVWEVSVLMAAYKAGSNNKSSGGILMCPRGSASLLW